MDLTTENGIGSTFSILQSKLDSIKKPNTNGQNLTDVEKSQLRETAKGFESIFVNIMYKGMKSAMLESIKDDSNDEYTFGADTLSGVTDMAFADYISNTNNGIGIAKMIYKQLTGEDMKKEHNNSVVPFIIRDAPVHKPIINSNHNNTATNNNFVDRVSERIKPYESIIQQASTKFGISP